MENNVRSEWLRLFRKDWSGCLALGGLSMLLAGGAIGAVADERVLWHLEMMARVFVLIGIPATIQIAQNILHTVIK